MQYIITAIVSAAIAFCIYHFMKWYEEAKAAGLVNTDYITKKYINK